MFKHDYQRQLSEWRTPCAFIEELNQGMLSLSKVIILTGRRLDLYLCLGTCSSVYLILSMDIMLKAMSLGEKAISSPRQRFHRYSER